MHGPSTTARRSQLWGILLGFRRRSALSPISARPSATPHLTYLPIYFLPIGHAWNGRWRSWVMTQGENLVIQRLLLASDFAPPTRFSRIDIMMGPTNSAIFIRAPTLTTQHMQASTRPM